MLEFFQHFLESQNFSIDFHFCAICVNNMYIKQIDIIFVWVWSRSNYMHIHYNLAGWPYDDLPSHVTRFQSLSKVSMVAPAAACLGQALAVREQRLCLLIMPCRRPLLRGLPC